MHKRSPGLSLSFLHCRVLARKHADVAQTVARHTATVRQTACAHETLMAGVADFSEWLQEMLGRLEQPAPVGVTVAEGEAALQEHYVSLVDVVRSPPPAQARIRLDDSCVIECMTNRRYPRSLLYWSYILDA